MNKDLEKYLELVAGIQPGGYEDLVKRLGVRRPGSSWRKVRRDNMHQGKIKECFKNALNLALAYDLTYCEGFAIGSVIPCWHAYCVDAEGRVVDPTWRDSAAASYVGLEFINAKITPLIVEHGMYGIFYSKVFAPYLKDEALLKTLLRKP